MIALIVDLACQISDVTLDQDFIDQVETRILGSEPKCIQECLQIQRIMGDYHGLYFFFMER